MEKIYTAIGDFYNEDPSTLIDVPDNEEEIYAKVEEIMEYRYRHGRIESMGELLMIRSLDYRQRRLLTCFLYIGEEKPPGFPSVDRIARYGKHELTTLARVPFYERKGDRNGYLGYPYKQVLMLI